MTEEATTGTTASGARWPGLAADAAAVEAIEEASCGAARCAAFTGVVLVVLGFGLNLLLPETREALPCGRKAEPPDPGVV